MTARKEWRLMTVRNPEGGESRVYVSADRQWYRVTETSPVHPINKLKVIEKGKQT